MLIGPSSHDPVRGFASGCHGDDYGIRGLSLRVENKSGALANLEGRKGLVPEQSFRKIPRKPQTLFVSWQLCDPTGSFVPNNVVCRFSSSKLVWGVGGGKDIVTRTKKGKLMRTLAEEQRRYKS